MKPCRISIAAEPVETPKAIEAHVNLASLRRMRLKHRHPPRLISKRGARMGRRFVFGVQVATAAGLAFVAPFVIGRGLLRFPPFGGIRIFLARSTAQAIELDLMEQHQRQDDRRRYPGRRR